VKGREFGAEDVGLSVEDVFRSRAEMEIVDLDQTVGVRGSGGVFGMRGEDELGILS
jgi:hypothetical protein